MKKTIVLIGVLMMGVALFGCSKKAHKSNNETVMINGKTYDLSKECDEIIEDFLDDMYVERCPFEEGKRIRYRVDTEEWDNEQNLYVHETEFYELDRHGEYVQMDPKDFDKRIMMEMQSIMCNTLGYKKEEIFGFTMTHGLNAPDFQISTANGISLGSSEDDVENTGAYEFIDSIYEIIYLDGKLVNYSDYGNDADRIHKMDADEWNAERQKVYKYNCLRTDYIGVLYNIDDNGKVMYLLAESDAYSQINSGVKDTLIKFQYKVTDGKVSNISFTVIKQSESGKESYKNFIKNK